MIRHYHLIAPFWIYSLLTMLLGSAAYTTQSNLMYWLFGGMIGGLLLSGLVSGMMMMSLRTVRVDPRHGSVGEPLVVRYAVTNRSPILPAFNIRIEELPQHDPPGRLARLRKGRAGAEQHTSRITSETDNTANAPTNWPRLMESAAAWIMHVGPRETVHGEAVFWPTRRGEATFRRLRVSTTFPFGIIRKSVTLTQPQHTLIYPRPYPLKPHVVRLAVPEGPIGMRVTNRSGAGDDYFGLRDYRPGDSLRHIAWKRAAGLDQIVSIERSKPNPPRVRIVMNLSQSLIPPGEARDAVGRRVRDLEERAISLAASLIHEAERIGFEVGLSVPGAGTPPIPIRRGHWHVGRMLAALAEINLDAARRPQTAAMPPDAERAAMFIVHPDRIDPTLGRSDALHLSATQMDQLIATEDAAPAGARRAVPPELSRPRSQQAEAAA